MSSSKPPVQDPEFSSRIEGPEKTYQTALSEGNFIIQRCEVCFRYVFFPRLLCTHCGSNTLNWVKPSGKGVVYSSTTVRRKSEDGGDHNVSLVDLLEGPRLMTRIEDVRIQDVRIGMQVQAEVRSYNQINILVFVPLIEK